MIEMSDSMNGILPVYKPQDYTSFDVVARIRGMSKTKKVGHSGTLDPMATGVLPIFLGCATKACDLLPNGDKKYVGRFQLGIRTDTLDVTGKELSRMKSNVRRKELEEVIPLFQGNILQLPPMYSAIKVDGQRLYHLARQGMEIERASRSVCIYSLVLLSFDEEKQQGELEISCSKGTYIRTLISDIGEKLHVGAIMTALVRTEAGGFSLSQCIALDEIQALSQEGRLEEKLLPVDSVFISYPTIYLNKAQSQMYQNGIKLRLDTLAYEENEGLFRTYNENREFLGLSSLDQEKKVLRIEKTFWGAIRKAENPT